MPKNNIIDVRRVEQNATEPLSLAEAKAHLIITFDDDNDYITSLITQCRMAIENYCDLSMVIKTVTLTADIWQEMELPYGPVLNGVTSVMLRTTPTGSGPVGYNTSPGNWHTDGDEFVTFYPNYIGSDWTTPVANQIWNRQGWPYGYDWNARYRIVYTAGPYFPNDLVLAILNEMAYRYENRGDAMEIRPTPSAEQGLCPSARKLADPYRRLSLTL